MSLILIMILLALPFGLMDIFAEALRKKKSQLFRSSYASLYHLFKYQNGFSKAVYYPLLLFQRIIHVFIKTFLSFKSQIASAIVMITVAVIIFVYLKNFRPFRDEFNDYFAGLNQLLLAVFYTGCLFITVFIDDKYSSFR